MKRIKAIVIDSTDKLQGSDKINHAMIENWLKVMPQRNITHIIN